MHSENTYCHMSEACKLLKEKDKKIAKYKKQSEKHLDDFFKISQKYRKALGNLNHIREIANKLKLDTIYTMSSSVGESIDKILSEVNEVNNEIKN